MEWQYVEVAPPAVVNQLANALRVAPIIARVMINRGIETADAARAFFKTDLENLHDPFLMADMEVAVKRLLCAMENNENVLIYGDYDVDGVTSTALLKRALLELGCDVPHYIPDRQRDGYGLSIEGIERARQNGVELIVAIDCGVSAIDEIKYARQHGIDVIVCDHHQPGPELPAAIAVLNPKRSDCPYPFKELAGVGVGFKLLQALYLHLGHDLQDLYRHVDLVAIGSAADIVPLVDENRALVKAGMARLNETDNVGLAALKQVCNLYKCDINTGHIVFVMAPRINAVGRMGDANRAVTLLTSRDTAQAFEIARVLESANRKRRSIDEDTFKEAQELVDSHCDLSKDNVIVLHKENWHTGVIGIVASRLVEKYYRPTILISTDNGVGKGSARSISGFNIYEALLSCTSLMKSFGGHKYAAGLTIETAQIQELKERLEEFASHVVTAETFKRRLLIDGEVRFNDIDERFMKFIKALSPYGPQNMRPVFVSRGLRVVNSPQIVGSNHLRFHVTQDNRSLDCIGFNLGHLQNRLIERGADVELAYLIEENTWQGRTAIQLRIKDIR